MPSTGVIYDDPAFFAGYSSLDRSVRGLSGSPEWPTMEIIIGAPTNLTVLDLGCGHGWFCRWAKQCGALRVVGVDVSSKMLDQAAVDPQALPIEYYRDDLESIDLPKATFDLVYSSLALHYISAYQELVIQVRQTLRPGGRFIFSVEHPIVTAPHRPIWRQDVNGRQIWSLDGYHDEGPRTVTWLECTIVKQHRTIQTYVMTLIQGGFVVEALKEWVASTDDIENFEDFKGGRREKPHYLLVSARAN